MQMTTAPTNVPSYETLNGIPPIDVPANVQAALVKGRRATGIAAETAALRLGPGRLTPQEYFYYRLWEARLPLAAKKAFIGKLAQHPMHVAAGSREWFATSADKILFHSIMAAGRFRVPGTLAITQAGRHLPDVPTIADADCLVRFLRDPSLYPLFAKQVAGKYSLSVVSADSYDSSSDEVSLLGGARQAVGALAASLVGGAGYLIQRRLSPAPALAERFGPRLWSVRLLVFVTPDGPLVHRAAAKIATGTNPADNYWRAGNRLGAIDLDTGRITRVVTGTGLTLQEDELHPDTQQVIVGSTIPNWNQIVADVKLTAQIFAGIRTQSWDIALADPAPTFLELNFGGDLNLHQLAHGRGVLDDQYRAHLRRCGYKGRL
jgi:Sugar-transfer associated ATP-grasp